MPIRAHLVPTEPNNARSRAARRQVRLELPGTSPSGEVTSVLVHNLSATGVLLETSAGLAIGERILVDLPHAGSVAAQVVWLSNNAYGCEFKKKLSAAALSAAQLLSPSESPTLSTLPLREPTETFGPRLRRLRRNKGLSALGLAKLAKVSIATVYNWERDKTRPGLGALESLSDVLGVPMLELREGKPEEVRGQAYYSTPQPSFDTGDEALPPALSSIGTPFRPETRLSQLIAASKEQLAALAGTTADKVRITLEF